MASKRKSPSKRSRRRTHHISKSRGSSNAGRYKNVPQNLFCGPAGGAKKGTYPVNSRKRCRAALSYARYAPKPCGIVKCVQKKCGNKVGSDGKMVRKCKKRSKRRS